jgi:hypothetical protein
MQGPIEHPAGRRLIVAAIIHFIKPT